MTAYNLLLVLKDADATDHWIKFALRLLPAGTTVHLRGMITVEEETSLSEGLLPTRALRDTLSQAARNYPEVDDDVRVLVDYRPFKRIIDEVRTLNADLVLAQSDKPISWVGGMSVEEVFNQIPCDVVLVSGMGWEQPGDVLLSLRGGANMTLGARVAIALTHDTASITLFHATDQRLTQPNLEPIANAVPQIRRTITANKEITAGIVEEASAHKVIVMGASFRRPELALASGNTIFEEVYRRTQKPMVLVRGARQEALEFHPPALMTAEMSLSGRVDQWFAENSFHSSEFSDLRELMSLKEKRGVTISIALPALNEEKTVGKVISLLKTALMDEIPLVDEIVLIDSNSTDNTVSIAQGLGIPTYNHPDILYDEADTYIGKGEALWKSLHVTQGDIIAWIDTDITNIHPRFIYGLLGPLLKRPNIQFVKGFYTRPILIDGKLQAYGGGRVTELVARPLLNLFYPELSGIVQPLSGEYAGRRSALEQIPFFTGYGVETGMLIDLHARYGLDAIAQTDLEVRVHHNQPLVNLSKMSFAILQVFIARIEAQYGVQWLDQANRTMKLVVQEPDRFALEIVAISDVERPSILSVPAYVERRAKTALKPATTAH